MSWKCGGMRHLGLLAAAGILGLALTGCGSSATPIPVIFLSPTPTVGPTPTSAALPTPAVTDATGPTAPPSATPASSTVCSGTSGASGTKEFWRKAAVALPWMDVYCTVVPGGWNPVGGLFDNTGSGYAYLHWNGPHGSKLYIDEGTFCAADPVHPCSFAGTEVGTALFGDRVGTLSTISGGFMLIVSEGTVRRYQLTATGIDRDTFVLFASQLVKVAKS